MKSFLDKVVVVTGGGSGVGRAICELFAESGSKVVIADVEVEKAEVVAEEIRRSGGKAVAHYVDITDEHSCLALSEFVQKHYGNVHVLVANAGVLMLGLLSTRSIADWRWTFDVNVFGTVRTVSAFMEQLQANSGDAHVLITCSMAGLRPSGPGKGVYNASKNAQLSYGETLRDELADEGINVSLLLPGPTVSSIADSERNRRPELGRGASVSDADIQMMVRHLGESEKMIEPSELLQTLLPDMLSNETWILPKNSQRSVIEERFKKLLERM
jgi:NAD(P)-dependent dehydrogenase (short-subunit alcohol dehydrogenase family)